MCECISKIKPDTMKALEEKYGSIGTISDGQLESVGMLIVGNRLVMQPIMTVSYKLARFKKDGSEGKPSKQTCSITFTYCPFCGNPYQASA